MRGWKYCDDCLRFNAKKWMKKHSDLFRETFPELCNKI